jgi:hypothetical protein
VPPLLALDLRLHVDVLGLLEGLEALATQLAAELRLASSAVIVRASDSVWC